MSKYYDPKQIPKEPIDIYIRSYIVAYTIFPKGYYNFKTKFEVFSSFKGAYNFYKSLKTENKCFYKQIWKEELEKVEDKI